MTKKTKLIIAAAAVLVVLAAGILVLYQFYQLPFLKAQNFMAADNTLILQEQDDGTLSLTWTEGINISRYRVELTQASNGSSKTLYSTSVETGTECVLPQFPRNERVTISVTGETAYRIPGQEKWRDSQSSVAVTGIFTPPAISELQWQADADAKTVNIQFSAGSSTACLIHTGSGSDEYTLYDTVESRRTAITFGEGKQLPMPSHSSPQQLGFSACTTADGYIHYGLISDTVTITREDLLGTALMLECTDQGNNVYHFSWNETKGETYQLQLLQPDGETWDTVYEIPQDGDRSYTTGHLDRYSDFEFRVVAIGGQTLPDSDFAATPDQASVSTGASVVYSAIWPQKELEVYSDTEKSSVLGTVKACSTYCVLDLKDGMFRIRYGHDTYGYIDSNYCFINLPDMIGDLCSYDISNSYSSVFMAHGYEIPTVTGTVITGYEQVELSENEYLVPLLYPVALKLEKAAFAAIEDGYKLKIYDSFRPRKATTAVYDQAKSLIEAPLPETTFSGEPMEEMPTVKEDEVLTYGNLITDHGRYTLNYFLARNGSRHNLGIAMDMTLEFLDSGEEVKMQSAIHDLSWYSELKRNNEYANKLSEIMTDAGFGTLVSEWWHFQDTDTQDALELEYTQNGVSPEGWFKDDTGWRYRLSNGSYYKNRTVSIADVEYTFGSDGYLVES